MYTEKQNIRLIQAEREQIVTERRCVILMEITNGQTNLQRIMVRLLHMIIAEIHYHM